MKTFFAIAAMLLTAFIGTTPASAQYDNRGNYGHYDQFQRGAYNGGRGGDYGYASHGHYDANERYHPNGIGPGKGAAIGAAGGAVLGALFGGGLKGAVIGGAAGAGVGALAGKAHQSNQRRGCYNYGNC
jgi:hypothetical protein